MGSERRGSKRRGVGHEEVGEGKHEGKDLN